MLSAAAAARSQPLVIASTIAFLILCLHYYLPTNVQSWELESTSHSKAQYFTTRVPYPLPSSYPEFLRKSTGRDSHAVSSYPPQPKPPSYYEDRLVAFGTEESHIESELAKWDFSGLNYTIIVPTFVGHFREAIAFLQSLRCLCTDINDIEIAFVLSSTTEVSQFGNLVQSMKPCGDHYGIYPMPANQTWNPQIHLMNLYDLLPSFLQKKVEPDNTNHLLEHYGKFKYQGLKKLLAARELRYDAALWIDSEAIVTQPFEMRPLFSQHLLHPIVWKSRHATHPQQVEHMRSAARILGRSLDSFGTRYLSGVENMMWFVETGIIGDMFAFVEAAHGKPFLKVFLETEGQAFEATIYHMHIQTRKLETGPDSIFARYKVLETERELIRWGLVPGFHYEEESVCGWGEVLFKLIKEPGMQPLLSAFLKRYGWHFQRIDDDFLLPGEGESGNREMIKRWIYESPVYMFTNGCPSSFHEWLAQGTEFAEKEVGANTWRLDG